MEQTSEGESIGSIAISLLQASDRFTTEVGLAVAAVVVLLFLSALVSGSEVAFFSLSPKQLKDLRASDSSRSKPVLRLLERPRYLLATILIANNLFNLGIIILSYFIVGRLLPVDVPAWQEILISVGVVTFVIVLFAEIMPKVYAQHANVVVARRVAPALLFLRGVFKPLSRLLVSSSRILERRLNRQNGSGVSLDDIDQAIDITADTGSAAEEVRILKGIVKFGGIRVTQIMKPRIDVVAIEEGTDYKSLLGVVQEHGFSRLPVYRDSLDEVSGILYSKDLLQHLNESNGFAWQGLVRPAYFVPETKRIEELLREFQTLGTHMAVVIDEYGGTTGLVTLEDIMEEIIGEIKDEFDTSQELSFQKVDDNTYVFEGKTLINDLCRELDIGPDTFNNVIGESDSLAGLLLELTKRIPRVREKVHFKHFTFEVMAATKKRIQSVKVVIGEDEDEEV